MKKLSIIILAVMLGLLVAPLLGGTIQAANPPLDRESAIVAAADRLVENQNDDGGFAWKLTDPPSISSHNVLGVTAMGILQAYALEPKETYREALANAYRYVVNTEPTYTWDGSKYIESSPKGVDSFPDVTFLIWLAQAAADDASLLTAIATQQGATVTAEDIANLAKTRWDQATLYKGSTQETSPNGTATTWAQRIRDERHVQGFDALIPWDLEAGVKAALALDAWFPGYAGQAAEVGEVIHESVDDAGNLYFSSTDQSQDEYVAGLTGAIEAYRELGVYATEVETLKGLLLNLQEADGSWDYYGDPTATMSVQSTAYAVMALARQGDEDALIAARKAADWLRLSQNLNGGWFSEDGAGDEYLEINSEAAWALATAAIVWVDAPNDTGDDGKTVVSVKLDPRGFEVFGFQFTLNYDSALLSATVEDVAPGAFFDGRIPANIGTPAEGDFTWLVEQPQAGTLKVWVTLVDNDDNTIPGITVDGSELAEVTFTAVQGDACGMSSYLTLSDEIVTQKRDGAQIPATTMDDSVVAYKLVPVSGVVELQGRASGEWNGATVSLENTTIPEFAYSVNTDGAGAWSQDVACGTYNVYVDMNAYLDAESKAAEIVSAWNRMVKLLGGNADEGPDSENIIFLHDVVAIANVIGKAAEDMSSQNLYPDINADGTINILDLVLAGINYTEEGPKGF